MPLSIIEFFIESDATANIRLEVFKEVAAPAEPIYAIRVANKISLAESGLVGDFNSKYTDLSLSFTPHPLTGAPSIVYNAAAINQSLRTLLLTNTNERPFSSMDIAGNIGSKLFDLSYDEATIAADIQLAIANYEPRISLIDTDVIAEGKTLKIRIVYNVLTFREVEEFTFIIERT